MRSRVFGLWVIVLAALSQSASALPLDVTYAVSGNIASVSGISGSVPFAGTVTIRFPGGGDPALGGALSYDGQLALVGGTITATGAALELSTGFVTSIVFPAAESFPNGNPFVAFFAPGFQAEGNANPGSLTLDIIVSYAPDAATGGLSGGEISRVLVPEPAAAVLLAAGVAASGLRARTRQT